MRVAVSSPPMARSSRKPRRSPEPSREALPSYRTGIARGRIGSREIATAAPATAMKLAVVRQPAHPPQRIGDLAVVAPVAEPHVVEHGRVNLERDVRRRALDVQVGRDQTLLLLLTDADSDIGRERLPA